MRNPNSRPAAAARSNKSVSEKAPDGTSANTAGDKGRLFGLRLDGVWMHVGTPDAVTAAEAVLAAAH